jgi:hypothetical protein
MFQLAADAPVGAAFSDGAAREHGFRAFPTSPWWKSRALENGDRQDRHPFPP